MAGDIEKLKFKIGYTFKNRALLKEALTHRSYAVENNLPYDNQRLEFLGDAVLEIILTEHLFNLYPEENEGNMTKMRSALVREEALAKFSHEMSFPEFMYLGKGELGNHGDERNSTIADLFEAIVGAWYLDGGFDEVKKFVIGLIEKFYPNPKGLLIYLNPKGSLQEYAQRTYGTTPTYQVLQTTGPEHDLVYEVEVRLNGETARGSAPSRKTAETHAAAELLKKLNINQD
jgi:ribonuclease-3